MNSLWYTYKTTSQILESITTLNEFSNYQFITLIFLLWLVLMFIYYILPLISLTVEFIKKDKAKNQRKNFIKTIALQRELEDEITREIESEQS